MIFDTVVSQILEKLHIRFHVKLSLKIDTQFFQNLNDGGFGSVRHIDICGDDDLTTRLNHSFQFIDRPDRIGYKVDDITCYDRIKAVVGTV